MSAEFIYLNEQLLPANEAGIPVDDRGFLLGDGLFETMRFNQSHAPTFQQHWTRLKNGCDILGIPFSLSAETIHDRIKTLLQKNHLENKTASVRITLTRGMGPRGLIPPKIIMPTLLICCANIPEKEPSPISVMHSNIMINEHSPLRQFKSLNYAENVIARQRALNAGYDDALLYNTSNFLVGTTCANVFLIIDDACVTPSLETGALPGIMRRHIIETAKQQTIPIHETALRKADCERAQAAFITNSIIQITPIQRLGNQQLMDLNKMYKRLIPSQ